MDEEKCTRATLMTDKTMKLLSLDISRGGRRRLLFLPVKPCIVLRLRNLLLGGAASRNKRLVSRLSALVRVDSSQWAVHVLDIGDPVQAQASLCRRSNPKKLAHHISLTTLLLGQPTLRLRLTRHDASKLAVRVTTPHWFSVRNYVLTCTSRHSYLVHVF